MRKSSKILWGSVICLVFVSMIWTSIADATEPSWVLYWFSAAMGVAAMYIGLPMGYIVRSCEKGKPKKWPYVIVALGVMMVFGCLVGMVAPEEMMEAAQTPTPVPTMASTPTATPTPTPIPTVTPAPTHTQTPVPTQTPIVYTEITVDTLHSDLERNALVAVDKHDGKYYAVRGVIKTIDAQGDYFSIRGAKDILFGKTIHCEITSDTVLQQLKTLSTGSTVTVYGEITSIGEVFGYFMDAHHIVK